MGASVGWLWAPARTTFPISVAGTYTIVTGTTLVVVSTTGAVIINLPSAKNPVVPAIAQPGPYVGSIISVVDIAGTPNVTINPAVGETIMGLSTVVLATPYGNLSLRPDNALSGWAQA